MWIWKPFCKTQPQSRSQCRIPLPGCIWNSTAPQTNSKVDATDTHIASYGWIEGFPHVRPSHRAEFECKSIRCGGGQCRMLVLWNSTDPQSDSKVDPTDTHIASYGWIEDSPLTRMSHRDEFASESMPCGGGGQTRPENERTKARTVRV